MDYIDAVEMARHADFEAFRTACPGRLLLLSTKGERSPYDFAFEHGDNLLFGKESAGVPAGRCGAMRRRSCRFRSAPQVRSFNLATAAALALGEALRQTGGLPR